MAIKIYITAIRLEHGKGSYVQYIERVWYGANPRGSIMDNDVSVLEMVRSIDDGTYEAYVQDPDGTKEARVLVIRPTGSRLHLRTRADGDPDDNLLKLPRK